MQEGCKKGLSQLDGKQLQWIAVNPKRKDTAAFKRFQKYCQGRSVEEVYELGGRHSDLLFDYKRGYVWAQLPDDREEDNPQETPLDSRSKDSLCTKPLSDIPSRDADSVCEGFASDAATQCYIASCDAAIQCDLWYELTPGSDARISFLEQFTHENYKLREALRQRGVNPDKL